MRDIVTAIEINASPERVWQVLTDFPSYAQWNPVVREIRGEAIPGSRLRVRVRFLDGLNVSFRPTVIIAERGRKLMWRGRVLFSWLFTGEHFFTIEPLGNGRVKFLQYEVYRGALVPVIIAVIGGRTRRVFEEMNRALKAHAESFLPDSV